MSKNWPAIANRVGWTLLIAVFCMSLGGSPALADTPKGPAVGKGEATAILDTSALVEFIAAPGDGKDFSAVVFYGKEDGNEAADAWDNQTDKALRDKAKGPSDYSVTLKDLEPDTRYFYRIRATTSEGTTWSNVAELRTEPAPAPWYIGFAVFAGVLALLIVPFLLGGLLSKRFRMPDHGWKIGLIICSLAIGIVICATGQLKLGIDLSGGVILVYELEEPAEDAKKAEEAKADEKEGDEAADEEAKQDIDLDKLISAVALRVNPGGTREVAIRKYGPKQIEIIIPRANEEEVRRIEKKVSQAGTLEFRILANNRDHKAEIALAQDTEARQVFDAEDNLVAWWVPVSKDREDNFASYGEISTRVANFRGQEVMEILVVKDVFNVTGGYLQRCTPGVDQHGRPCVNFVFNSRGGQLFGGLTGANTPDEVQDFTRKLGIVLDGYLYSAPSIQSAIYQRGEISGTFTDQEVEDLVDVLNAGSLPTALKENPISKLSIGPTLGADTIEKGKWAIGISMVMVLIFMLIYYRFAGMVACGALLMNLVLILGIMIGIKADFTLPGLAGLVLTVGMAVDANVLIFERIREELARDAALRMAIRNGFARATTTIVDANLTTLITATVLYVVGTPQIKGFAVVLWLGVVLSMYTAIFCSRVVFDIAERQGWLTKLKMMQILHGTKIDFVGFRKVGAAFSLTLILIGMVSVYSRGKGLLDIDFTGGESVEVLFEKPQDIADVRVGLEDLPDLAVSDVQIAGEETGLRFVINTSKTIDEEAPDEKGKSATDVVETHIHEVFGDKLDTNALTVDAVAPIGSSGSTEKKSEEKKPAADDQTRDDLPSSTLLASTDPAAVLLAQADPAKKPAEKADEKPAAAPAEKAKESPVKKVVDRFAGGTQAELTFKHALDHETLDELITAQLTAAKVPAAAFRLSNEEYEPGDTAAYENWVLKIKLPEAEAQDKLLKPLQAQLADTPFFPSSSAIGGKVAGDMQEKAVIALLGSLLCIVGYIWIRFQRVMFGVAAVVALVHDILITLGAIAISAYLAPIFGFLLIDPFKISLSVLAAFLTIIGYSLNDTIVVFDRIREVRGKSPNLTGDMVNTSINQTLSRTLLTSITTLIVVLILYLGGGQGIHAFAFSLLVGVVIGTYSSIFVASPVLLWMSKSLVKPSGRKS